MLCWYSIPVFVNITYCFFSYRQSEYLLVKFHCSVVCIWQCCFDQKRHCHIRVNAYAASRHCLSWFRPIVRTILLPSRNASSHSCIDTLRLIFIEFWKHFFFFFEYVHSIRRLFCAEKKFSKFSGLNFWRLLTLYYPNEDEHCMLFKTIHISRNLQISLRNGFRNVRMIWKWKYPWEFRSTTGQHIASRKPFFHFVHLDVTNQELMEFEKRYRKKPWIYGKKRLE